MKPNVTPSPLAQRSALHLALRLALGVVAGALLAGCPEDDPRNGECAPGDDFCAGQLPRLATQPAEALLEIVDAGMATGETQLRTVRIINVGTATLSVRAISLEYAAPAGADDQGTPAFRLVPLASTLPVPVEAFGGLEFPQGLDVAVEYTKRGDALPREATLVIESNDRFFAQGETRITITTAVGAPSLSVTPNPVDFGLVPRSDTPVARTLNLINTGPRALNVTGFKTRLDGRFGFRGPGFEETGADAFAGVDLEDPIVVEAGASRAIEVTFLSDSPTPAQGELLVFSDDPRSGTAGLAVSLVANKSGPCVDVTPRRVEFGGKVVGSVSTIDFEIKSCGTEALSISSLAWKAGSSPDFELDFSRLPAGYELGPNPANPLSIPVNSSVLVGVDFVPDGVNPRNADNVPIPDEGIVLVGSNGYESQLEVQVRGAGAEVECPTPVIVVEEGEEVIPQTVIHLDGRQSFAPFGSIRDYFWSVTAPDGIARPILIPSFTDPRPVAELNAVGLYTFGLKVRDEFGNSSGSGSCPDASFQVLVQPDQAIHVELTWVTPGDADETDTGEGNGTDLDLHFAHQNAVGPDLDGDTVPDPWFDRTWDVFWYNKAPQWGSFDPAVRDDPSLDRDDVDGAGPENMNLAIPEDGTTYKIAVHYWNDYGFGPANATVKVFHYADEVYAATLPNMNRLDMWCVGEIHWPTPAVTRCAEEGQPEWITPNYVNMFFQPF
jgi:hypothetical protein